MVTNEAFYEYLYNLIQSQTGLVLDERRRSDVAHVAEKMLATLQLTSVNDLVQLLQQYPSTHPVWQELVSTITVGETYFFRNQDHFNALRNTVLPHLIEQRRSAGNKQHRLWSAGCATGEEPYSLAILLRELISDIDSWQISILATDINQSSLNHAQMGLYRAWSFRNETPANIRDEWFTPENGSYRLSNLIRSMVVFAPLNLVTDRYPSFETGTMYLDMIICRNVTIYFEETTTRMIAKQFYNALREDGWLIVGHAEPMATVYQGFAPQNFENAVFYQKCPVMQEAPVFSAPVVVPPPVVKQPDPEPPRYVPAPKPIQQSEPEENPLDKAIAAANGERWPEAMVWLERAERKNILQPEIHYLRGLVHLHNGDVQHALVSLRRAVYCDPDFALAHYALGDLFEKSGDFKKAARHWQMAQSTVVRLDGGQPMPCSDDLTAAMLNDLITHRLKALPGANNVSL